MIEKTKKAQDFMDTWDAFNTYKNDLFYKFEMLPIEEEYYRQLRESDKKFAAALEKKKNMSQDIYDQIRKSIIIGSNVVVQINGKPNSGKSKVALKIVRLIMDAYEDLTDVVPEYQFSTDYLKTTELLSGPQADLIVHQDEGSKQIGEDARLNEIRLANQIQSMRKKRKHFIICNPKRLNVPALNFCLECLGKLRDRFAEKEGHQETRVMVLYPDDNAKSGANYSYVGHAILILDESIEEMEQEYLPKKDENIAQIERGMGGVTQRVHKDKEREWALQLLEYAKKEGWSGLSKSHKSFDPYYADMPFALGQSPAQRDRIKRRAIDIHLQKRGEQKSKAAELMLKDDPLLKKAIKNIRGANFNDPNIGRNCEIFMMRESGLTNPEIAEKFGMHYSNVSKIYNEIAGSVWREVGHVFQHRFYLDLKKGNEYEKVIEEGKSDEHELPDILAFKEKNLVLHIYSCKVINSMDVNGIPIDKFSAEIEYFRLVEKDYKEIKLFAVIFNRPYQKQKNVELDIKNLPSEIRIETE